MFDNLMPIAASIVVGVYAAAVALSVNARWYEWATAAAGAGFAVWFWYAEFRRSRRSARRGR